ncbi:Pycsar system effector family protein [Pontibacter silvestris]|uniref:Pycsar system effector family protein n=1 Tax=Pontibacter silvestris TaxID=2305183 RepID=A0ABW4X2D5_9BACT|nr:Pycsar system effector family protein [Pontibacter silvestris]MCC9137556.1 DUF5706 domain-containing protein [Pontibacter silvestris]
MNYSVLLQDAESFIKSYIKAHSNPLLVYHNLEHTEQVVAIAGKIANYYQLADDERFSLITAAWFHDIGYMDDFQNHEQAGAQRAAAYLADKGLDEKAIEAIQNCILATALWREPTNMVEQIIKDADLFHFGTDDFKKRSRLLREEVEALNHISISKEEWRESTIALLEAHHYYTGYCQELLNEKKLQNLNELRMKAAPRVADPIQDLLQKKEIEKGKGKGKKAKKERPDRGVETMFRVTSNNSQRLSDQADTKANILITVNSIIVSVLLSTVVREIEQNEYLTIPSIMLLIVCLTTIVFSILATRPHVPQGTFSQREVDEKKVNLLFFGNFYRMPFDKYAQGMSQMMDDRDFLYLGLMRDVFSQGVVLGKKYRMLKIAYNVFMFGLILSVVAFFVASKYYA